MSITRKILIKTCYLIAILSNALSKPISKNLLKQNDRVTVSSNNALRAIKHADNRQTQEMEEYAKDKQNDKQNKNDKTNAVVDSIIDFIFDYTDDDTTDNESSLAPSSVAVDDQNSNKNNKNDKNNDKNKNKNKNNKNNSAEGTNATTANPISPSTSPTINPTTISTIDPTTSPTINPTTDPSSQPSILIDTLIETVATTNQTLETAATPNITATTQETTTNENILVFFSILPKNNLPQITNDMVLNNKILNEIVSFTSKSLCHQLNDQDIIITSDDDLSNGVTNICINKYRRIRERNQRALFEESSTLVNKINENITVLQYTIPANKTSSLLYIVEKKVLEHDVNYYEIGVKYNILKIGRFITRDILQEEAQAAMMRSIMEYHNTDQTLDGDIKDVSIVGNELSTFHLTVESKGFLSAIRVLGLLILFLTSITITFFLLHF